MEIVKNPTNTMYLLSKEESLELGWDYEELNRGYETIQVIMYPDSVQIFAIDDYKPHLLLENTDHVEEMENILEDLKKLTVED